MSLKRSSHLLPTSTQFRDFFKISKYFVQPKFEDTFAKKAPKFEMSNALLNHMINLRLWTTVYAPTTKEALQRQQEINLLNNELQYRTYKATWRNFVLYFFAFFLITRVFRKKFMKFGNQDSIEMSWRDIHAIQQ